MEIFLQVISPLELMPVSPLSPSSLPTLHPLSPLSILSPSSLPPVMSAFRFRSDLSQPTGPSLTGTPHREREDQGRTLTVYSLCHWNEIACLRPRPDSGTVVTYHISQELALRPGSKCLELVPYTTDHRAVV